MRDLDDHIGTIQQYMAARSSELPQTESEAASEDLVNHPKHYKMYKGLEVIDLTEQMNFNRGNAIKYICRAGHKGDASTEVEDLRKAAWYINREIERIDGRPESG